MCNNKHTGLTFAYFFKMKVIIIGAGASGLLAAKTLSKAGVEVMILEARERLGGRIYTLSDGTFPQPAELGAEFVHGNLKQTLSLLKEANIDYYKTGGQMWQVKDGVWQQGAMFDEQWNVFIEKLQQLQTDISIGGFLKRNFAGDEYEALRQNLTGYVEGYDAADINFASAIAFRDEWFSEEGEQFRIKNGYAAIINFLAAACKTNGATILLNHVAEHVQWQTNKVEITTTDQQTFVADKAIITVPVGVLQADALSEGAIAFTPALPEKMEAAKQIGFNSVIKILIQFNETFWEGGELMQQQKQAVKNVGFIFSQQTIATWWTQAPQQTPLLTGWLAGPKANLLKEANNHQLLQQAIQSLATIFNTNVAAINKKIVASKVFNWGAEPFTRGAYTSAVIGGNEAKNILMQPVDDTLFFAGEGLSKSASTGTVEAAFISGFEVANKILHSDAV